MIEIDYITCPGRSGSTLVGSVLGLAPRRVFVGELRGLWKEGLKENQPCGCGRNFRDCDFWRSVFAQAFGGFDAPGAVALAAMLRELDDRSSGLRGLRDVWLFRRGRGPVPDRLAPIARLYAAIVAVSGAAVVVDSSKSLRYAALLAATPGLEPRLTNLIRDPRGLISSRSKRALRRDGSERTNAGSARRMRIVRTVAKWALRNALAARAMRRDGGIRLIYEDFVRDQRWYLAAVLGSSEAATVELRLAQGIGPEVVQHQLGGNWVRGLKISPVERWRSDLPLLPRLIAGALSAPFRAFYRSRVYQPR